MRRLGKLFGFGVQLAMVCAVFFAGAIASIVMYDPMGEHAVILTSNGEVRRASGGAFPSFESALPATSKSPEPQRSSNKAAMSFQTPLMDLEQVASIPPAMPTSVGEPLAEANIADFGPDPFAAAAGVPPAFPKLHPELIANDDPFGNAQVGESDTLRQKRLRLATLTGQAATLLDGAELDRRIAELEKLLAEKQAALTLSDIRTRLEGIANAFPQTPAAEAAKKMLEAESSAEAPPSAPDPVFPSESKQEIDVLPSADLPAPEVPAAEALPAEAPTP